MTEELFPYQREGATWLAGRKTALLADDMGLGKSAQVVAACDAVNAKRVLVLCPASARMNWVREFEKFSTQKRESLVITTKRSAGTSDLTVCSYDLAQDLAAKCLENVDVLVLDECHFLKSTSAKRTKAVLGKQGLVRKARRVWAVSGTPAPNHPAELWPLLKTFGVTELNYEDFVRRYCTVFDSGFGIQITGTRLERIPELRGVLARTMLRRKKEEVLKQLPPIHFTDEVIEPGEVILEATNFSHYCLPDRTDELAEIIAREEELIEKALGVTDRNPERPATLGAEALEALANSVSTLRRYVGLQKVEPVANMVTEELVIGRYDKLVMFAIHRDVIDQLHHRLKKFNPVVIYGATTSEARQANIDRFQKDPSCCLFIGNILAAGTAITLTAANHVMFVEQDWVPGNNSQAAMRCHRIGQTKPVIVRFVGLANSVDARVSQVLRRKTADLTKIFDHRE